jgi:hypothetical protein
VHVQILRTAAEGLFAVKHHSLKAKGGSDSIDPCILHTDSNEFEWTASLLGHVTLRYLFRRRLGGPHGWS